MHLKSKKSRSENFCRIERTLENTGFSRVQLAETEGFEPSSLRGHHDFEGRETAKTVLYFRISSYRLSAKSLVNKGFSCIL